MDEIDDNVALEIEALRSLYGDDAFSVSHLDKFLILRFPLLPRYVEMNEIFVAATLVLQLDKALYPSTAVRASLEQPKGCLTDSICNRLESNLNKEAENLAGELVLGHLCELSLDLLTDANHNAVLGQCVFCLESMTQGEDRNQVLRLPCYHCFHAACFGSWFRWTSAQQGDINDTTYRVDASTDNNKNSTDKATRITCPSCRYSFEIIDVSKGEEKTSSNETVYHRTLLTTLHAHSDTANINASIEKTRAETNAGGGDEGERVKIDEISSWREAVDSDMMHQIEDMQREFAALLDIQRSRGGLVQESVAVSLADLEAERKKRLQLEGHGGSG